MDVKTGLQRGTGGTRGDRWTEWTGWTWNDAGDRGNQKAPDPGWRIGGLSFLKRTDGRRVRQRLTLPIDQGRSVRLVTFDQSAPTRGK